MKHPCFGHEYAEDGFFCDMCSDKKECKEKQDLKEKLL